MFHWHPLNELMQGRVLTFMLSVECTVTTSSAEGVGFRVSLTVVNIQSARNFMGRDWIDLPK
jgi:hypothetical protein